MVTFVILSYDNETIKVDPVIVALCILGLGAALVAAAVVQRVRAVGSGEAELFALEHGIARTPDGLELCRRYLSRARQFRFTCSFAGFLAGIVLGHWAITWLPGWFVGVIATELFRLRPRRRSGPQRTASLERRSASRYVPSRLAWHARILAVAIVAATIAALLVPWRSDRTPLILLAIGAVVILGAAEACQHAIAARTRPALASALEEADDVIRHVGAKAVGFAASGALAALLGLTCLVGFRGAGVPAHLSGSMTVVGFLALLWALGLGVEEHRFFWPKAPSGRRARRMARS
jgi:hypothetical protein